MSSRIIAMYIISYTYKRVEHAVWILRYINILLLLLFSVKEGNTEIVVIIIIIYQLIVIVIRTQTSLSPPKLFLDVVFVAIIYNEINFRSYVQRHHPVFTIVLDNIRLETAVVMQMYTLIHIYLLNNIYII